MKSYLLNEFTAYYTTHRCRWAPENPRRVLGLAEKLYREFHCRVSAAQFLSVLYQTLDGLFEDFDAKRYEGTLKLDDHFINMLAARLRTNLRRSARPRTDQGRSGDARFQARPELGIVRGKRVLRQDDSLEQMTVADQSVSLEAELRREEVRQAVLKLPEREQYVVRGRYWENRSDAEIGERLNLNRSTVWRAHKDAISQMRDYLSA